MSRYTAPQVTVESPHLRLKDGFLVSSYDYHTTQVQVRRRDSQARAVEVVARPSTTRYEFRTKQQAPDRCGLLMVGWGGNNGSTVTAGLIANRRHLAWQTREGVQRANFYGSITQCSTVKLGDCDAQDPSECISGENAPASCSSSGHVSHDVYVPLNSLVPMVHPDNLVVGGWDISGMDLASAMDRAAVLEPDLKRQVRHEMSEMRPMPSVYYPDFIAANQSDRADNVLPGADKQQHLERIRDDIRRFKAERGLDSCVVVWTANTERFSEVLPGVHDTADNLLAAVRHSHPEVAPSCIFALAAILEGVPFINGSPQNTLLPGVIELAMRHGVFVGGDDFKSGQTKIKSVLVDFLVSAGIKPLSIASYNHLGNNDGKNLSAPSQFRSKEISKSNVVDDMVASNPLLYGSRAARPATNGKKRTAEQMNGQQQHDALAVKKQKALAASSGNGADADADADAVVELHGDSKVDTEEEHCQAERDHPDHVVVIKYLPAVGDSKRALDEYNNEIFLGGRNTISLHNTCEDSLLASPLILDLAILTELFTRVQYRVLPEHDASPAASPAIEAAQSPENNNNNSRHSSNASHTSSSSSSAEFRPLHSVLSILSYLLKAPMVPAGTPVINSLFKQRACIENVLRALVALPPQNDMLLQHKCRS